MTDWSIDSHVSIYAQPTHGLPACPYCKSGQVVRVRRRLVDRFISLLYPLQRYRCRAMGCEWAGNVATKRLFYRVVSPMGAEETETS